MDKYLIVKNIFRKRLMSNTNYIFKYEISGNKIPNWNINSLMILIAYCIEFNCTRFAYYKSMFS